MINWRCPGKLVATSLQFPQPREPLDAIYLFTHSVSQSVTVMANFMDQLDGGAPNIWLNLILGTSVRVFLDEIGI